MTIRIDGSNTTANPGITGADADTGLQFGTDEVKIVTGGSDRVTVDSSGRVGVGTASPSNLLHLSATGANCVQKIERASGASFFLEAQSTNFECGTTTNSPIVVYTNNTEKARIDASGYLRLASGTGGLQFNGDTAAANALDDYEEGTWTVTLRGGSPTTPTHTATPLAAGAHNAKYVKIGNKVFFHFYERWNISTWTGSWTGINFELPFTPDNYGPINISYWSGFFNTSISSAFQPAGYVDPNGLSRITLQAITQSGESDNNNGSIQLSSSAGLMISGIYTTT